MKKIMDFFAVQGLRRLTVIVLLVFLLLPAAVQAAQDLTVTGTSGTDWDYTSAGVLTFKKGGEYTISMNNGGSASNNRIVINAAAIYSDTREIKLTLSGLKLTNDSGKIIEFTNTTSANEITAEFVIDGENVFSSGSLTAKCLEFGNSSVNVIFSGDSGSLKATSSVVNKGDDLKAASFTLNGNVEITLQTFAMQITNTVKILKGTLDLRTDTTSGQRKDSIAAEGLILAEGGKLLVSNNRNKSCIAISSDTDQQDMDGYGIKITGGEMKLSGNVFYGIKVNTTSDHQKDILISGGDFDFRSTFGGASGFQILGNGFCDFTIAGGKIRSQTTANAYGGDTGIHDQTTTGGGVNLIISGGEIEIFTKDHSASHAISNIRSLTFSDAYIHKNYAGNTQGTRTETADSSVVTGTAKNSKSYLLIIPANKISYTLNGGSLPAGSSNPELYSRIDLPKTLVTPEKDAVEFLGWTGSNGDTPQTTVTIPDGTAEDLAYTANFTRLSFSVNIIKGEGMTLESGDEQQTVMEGDPITDVIYTADDDHYFPEDYTVPEQNGISVTRDSFTQITVSGQPGGNTEINVELKDAAKKEKEKTPEAKFEAAGTDCGTLSDVTKGMQYSLDGGETWTDITDTSVNISSGVTTENGIRVRKPGNGITTVTSDEQIITITKAETPSSVPADCTNTSNNDGKLTGVSDAMEYRKAGEETWTDCGGDEVTGLTPGVYEVRVKANGTVLASDTQEVRIKAIINADAEGFSGVYDGKEHGIKVEVSDPESGYVIKYGEREGEYTQSTSPTIKDADTLIVYYQITAEGYVTLTGSAAVKIKNADSSVTVPPTPNDRIYDKTMKPLLNSDGKANGGTLVYAIGKDPKTPPEDSDYSGSIPEGSDAGTYYVWYKVRGGKNYNDSEPFCVAVTIYRSCNVTVTAEGNGTASADPASGPTGTEVTLTAQPEEGWEFKEWVVIESGGGTLQSRKTAGVSETAVFIIGTADAEIEAVFEKSQGPTPPEPCRIPFFCPDKELPRTGITGKGMEKPASLKYEALGMELFIPSLDVRSDIVMVPWTDEGYPVTGLEMDAGLLEGSALPGSGIAVIAGHNTLNAEQYGPFALLSTLEEGDVLFVRRPNGELMRFTVCLNEKIAADDTESLMKAAAMYENTLTLLTCEDEMPEGGYAARRIVTAK